MLIRYIELNDTTNLPRWLNTDHFEKFELGATGAKLYVVALRARAIMQGETIGRSVFMVPPVVAQQTGLGPWVWWDGLAKLLEP